MFGHDNNDNNGHQDDQGQISLPPANAFDDNSDNNGNRDNGTVSPQLGAPSLDDQQPQQQSPVTHRPSAQQPGAVSDELLSIKQEALQALTPLVDHLDQTPEEKFRTTMMMIQAADNQDLIRVAYEAAQKISSDKERAQAFLDIVNEINYFTQQNNPAA